VDKSVDKLSTGYPQVIHSLWITRGRAGAKAGQTQWDWNSWAFDLFYRRNFFLKLEEVFWVLKIFLCGGAVFLCWVVVWWVVLWFVLFVLVVLLVYGDRC
jgi:hypothetical protein